MSLWISRPTYAQSCLARKTYRLESSAGTATVFLLRSRIACDAIAPEQFKAADVESRQDDDRIPRLQVEKERGGEMRTEVDLTGGKGRRDVCGPSFGMNCTSVNPSPRSSSSATYWGPDRCWESG